MMTMANFVFFGGDNDTLIDMMASPADVATPSSIQNAPMTRPLTQFFSPTQDLKSSPALPPMREITTYQAPNPVTYASSNASFSTHPTPVHTLSVDFVCATTRTKRTTRRRLRVTAGTTFSWWWPLRLHKKWSAIVVGSRLGRRFFLLSNPILVRHTNNWSIFGSWHLYRGPAGGSFCLCCLLDETNGSLSSFCVLWIFVGCSCNPSWQYCIRLMTTTGNSW